MQQSWDKRTALHFAAQHCHPTVIRQLLLHSSLRQSPSFATPSSAMQYPPMQPALQQHPQSPDADQQQDLAMTEDVLPESHLQAPASYNAQTDSDNSTMLQQADAVLGHASIQDAASSLQSLQSGIQYEPYAAGSVSRQETDTTNNCSDGVAEQLDYTGDDANAMEALLALTSECSVQFPPQLHNPAGSGCCEVDMLCHDGS